MTTVIAVASSWSVIAATIGIAYLIGSIPTALIVGRTVDVDIRDAGDANLGWWNARAQLGERRASLIFVGDLAKGVVAAVTGLLLANVADAEAAPLAVAATGAAMAGHAFPVFARFRGGRSILTYVGGAAVVGPLGTALAVMLLGLLRLCRVRFRIASVVAVAVSPLFIGLTTQPAIGVGMFCCQSIIGLRFLQAHRADRHNPSDD